MAIEQNQLPVEISERDSSKQIPYDDLAEADEESQQRVEAAQAEDPAEAGEPISKAALAVEASVASVEKLVAGLMEYEVVYDGFVSVRRRPDPQAPEVGLLDHGATVRGLPCRGWLLLRAGGAIQVESHLEGHWVFIGHRLAAKCMDIVMDTAFAEAVCVRWPGIPAEVVAYSLEWQRKPGAQSASLAHDSRLGGFVVCRSCTATVSGMPPAAPARVRASARILDASDASGSSDVGVFGPWCDVGTGPEITAEYYDDHPHLALDPFGEERAGCAETKCSGFVITTLSGIVSATAENMQLCQRCGAHYKKHRLAREA